MKVIKVIAIILICLFTFFSFGEEVKKEPSFSIKKEKKKKKKVRKYQTEPTWKELPKITAYLPLDFSYSKKRGADFDVYSFRKKSDTVVLLIYMGNHPSISQKGEELTINNCIWHTQKTDYGYFSNYYKTNVSSDKNLIMHVIVQAKDEKDFKEVQFLASYLKVSKSETAK